MKVLDSVPGTTKKRKGKKEMMAFGVLSHLCLSHFKSPSLRWPELVFLLTFRQRLTTDAHPGWKALGDHFARVLHVQMWSSPRTHSGCQDPGLLLAELSPQAGSRLGGEPFGPGWFFLIWAWRGGHWGITVAVCRVVLQPLPPEHRTDSLMSRVVGTDVVQLRADSLLRLPAGQRLGKLWSPCHLLYKGRICSLRAVCECP